MLQGVHMATDGGGRKDLRHDRVVSPAGAPGSLEAQRVGRMTSRMAPWWSGTEVREEELGRRRGAGRTAVGEKKNNALLAETENHTGTAQVRQHLSPAAAATAGPAPTAGARPRPTPSTPGR